MLAYKITDWADKFEVSCDGKVWRPDSKAGKRKTGLDYIRCPVLGLNWPQAWRIFQEAAGTEADRVFGLYIKLLEIAGSRSAEERGWVLDDFARTMGPVTIAKNLGFDPKNVLFALDILIYKVGWVQIEECAFAREGNESVRLEAVRTLLEGLPPATAGLSQRQPALAVASERNRNGNIIEIQSEQPPAAAASLVGSGSCAGEEAPIRASSAAVPNGPAGGEPRGLPVRGPEETEPRPKAEDREDESRAEEEPNAEPMTQPNGPRTESREAEEPKSRAGAADRQGASARQIKETISEPYQPDPNEPGLKDQPDGKPTSQKYGPGGSLLPWDIDALEVMREDPRRCLLEGLSPNPRYAREQVIDRALGWCKKLLPQLEPPLGASDYARQEARKDAACIENRLVEAWDREGGGELICLLIADLQKILRTLQQRGNRGRGENNVMKIWVSNCRKLHGLGLKPSPSSPPP